MSIDPEKTLPFDEFIEYLKCRGFTIGVDHYLRLQSVLKTFGPNCRPEELKYLLSPIFATDKKEQEQFYRLFDSYFKIFVPREKQKSEKHIEKTEKRETIISPDIAIPRKRPYILFGILLLSLAALLAHWQVNYRIEKQPNQEHVTVSPIKVVPALPGVKEITITLHIPPPPQELPFFQRYGQWIRWILIFAPLILLILIRFYQLRRKRLVLLRQHGKRPPYVWPIRVEPQEPRFLKNPQFFSASRYLRQRLQSDIYRLDIEKTIDETIEQSGYPALCYKAATRPPEYLALIDLSGEKDHFARYAESITRILEDEGIFMFHYFYKNDPMVCFRESEGRREYEDLSVLQTRFRHCRLIIFSTGEGLLDPLTGELGPWEEPLGAWTERAIMTPKQPREWGIHEKVLSQGFILAPATCEGLEALAQSFSNGDQNDLKEWIRKDTFPPVPDTDAVHDMERLRSFCRSKDTFQWLCACAVYPELDWNLTLYLQSCITDSPPLENQMLTLIRLPWFSEGAIPDDNRFLLIRELDKERLQSVQESIFHVLEENPPPRESFAYDGYCLNLFAHRRVLKRMTRKQLRELRRAIKGADEDRIIQDYTLMTLLDSSKISPLGLILPKVLHKIFFRHGLPFFGLKSTVLFLLALIILSISAFLFIKAPVVPRAGTSQDVPFEFVSIPPGTFMMGSPEGEKGRYKDETQHLVTLTSGFYMQKTEVTQGQWMAVMGNNPSDFDTCGNDCPVERVSWNDVQEFIKRLNRIEGEGKFRLPTESEWEYACRAGSTAAFANGDITETGCGLDANLDKMGWYCGNSEDKTHKVGEREPNAWGLYDMHGNVYEWCQDWYGDYEKEVKDPTGPSKGSYRILRGGGWGSNARLCRSALRNGLRPGLRNDDLGFRLVRSLH